MASTEDGQPAASPRIPVHKRLWTIAFVFATFGVASYANFLKNQADKYRRALEEEQLKAAKVILPFLQAEEDQRSLKALKKKARKERDELFDLIRKNHEERSMTLDDVIKIHMKFKKPQP